MLPPYRYHLTAISALVFGRIGTVWMRSPCSSWPLPQTCCFATTGTSACCLVGPFTAKRPTPGGKPPRPRLTRFQSSNLWRQRSGEPLTLGSTRFLRVWTPPTEVLKRIRSLYQTSLTGSDREMPLQPVFYTAIDMICQPKASPEPVSHSVLSSTVYKATHHELPRRTSQVSWGAHLTSVGN